MDTETEARFASMQKDIQDALARLDVVSDGLSRVEIRLDGIEVQLSMEFATVHQQFAELRALLSGTQPKSPES
jgi:ABC-type transporter Mla subunit MlaD